MSGFSIVKDSRFLYADDLRVGDQWREFSLTIKEVFDKNTITTKTKKAIDKYALSFEETSKLLVLCTTSVRCLMLQYGSKSADWVGKKATLYPAVGDAFGESNVPFIRIRIPQGTPVPRGIKKHLGTDLTT